MKVFGSLIFETTSFQHPKRSGGWWRRNRKPADRPAKKCWQPKTEWERHVQKQHSPSSQRQSVFHGVMLLGGEKNNPVTWPQSQLSISGASQGHKLFNRCCTGSLEVLVLLPHRLVRLLFSCHLNRGITTNNHLQVVCLRSVHKMGHLLIPRRFSSHVWEPGLPKIDTKDFSFICLGCVTTICLKDNWKSKFEQQFPQWKSWFCQICSKWKMMKILPTRPRQLHVPPVVLIQCHAISPEFLRLLVIRAIHGCFPKAVHLR